MKLNEGLVFKTKLDEESVLYLEKVIESLCLCLPIYKEITFFVPEKKSDSFVVIKSVSMNAMGSVETNEGESICYEDSPIAKSVLDSGEGQIKITCGETGGSIYMPISKCGGFPYGVAKLDYLDKEKTQEDFAFFFGNANLMNGVTSSCHSNFMVDPIVFIPKDKGRECLNDSAKIFKERVGAPCENWGEKFWEERQGNPSLEDIALRKYCAGIDVEIEDFQFFLIAFPIYQGESHIGMMVSIVEISMIKNMFKEVICKSTIIKEVHHRVKNNLQTIASLLRLQKRRTNSSVVGKAFIESINRISSIALVYEALSQEDKNVVDMKGCIQNILSMIIGNMVEPNKSVKGEIRGQDIYLNGNQASNVSLCITELVQNALEHAFVFRKNGNIIVTLKQVNNEIIITVEDDGVGLSGKKTKSASLGLDIINMITKESLKGSFKLESHTYGTVGEIRFPL
jgi:two-component sensor histidine kinase